MPSTPMTASTTVRTIETMAMGVKRMLQNARLASQVSGEVRRDRAMSATDQASRASASRLTSHHASLRPPAMRATELDSTAANENVAAVQTTGSTGLPLQLAGGQEPHDGTDHEAGEGQEAQLLDGRAAHDVFAGDRGQQLVLDHGGLEGERSATTARTQAEGHRDRDDRAQDGRALVGEVLQAGPAELGLLDLARGQQHQDDAGPGGQVDVVERVDPVDALEPVVAPGPPQVLERAFGGRVGHHDRKSTGPTPAPGIVAGAYPATVILVDLDRVSASRPGRPLFDDLSLTLSTGDRLGVVGLNGSGKSTLLRVLTGDAEPESGVVRRGRGVRIAALDQRPQLGSGRVADVVAGSQPGEGPADWEVAAVLDRIGLGSLVDADVGTLSGGQAKRVALARTLVTPADLLVLDEPTNHLDIDGIDWLEDRLADFRGGLVLVTHDRHLLDRLTTRILEIDRGRSYVHEGGYAAFLEARAVRDDQAADAEASRRNLARKELAWLRRGAPARTRKPKARIEAATATVEGRAEAPARVGIPDLHLGTPRLGDKVVELHGVGHHFDDQPPLFSGVDLLLDNRERLGVVGPNGSGKSTLLDLIAGRRRPSEGRVVLGPTVQLGYYDQLGGTLDPTQRVRDAVTGEARVPDWRDAALLEQFWFSEDTQWAPIGLLSGGERRRLQLLITLAARPNVLLLDEPTNDLDVDTLRVLEEFLDDWPGALVVVSHDRAFLERTVADVIVLDGSGAAGRRPGGYAGWEAERRARREGPGRGPSSPRSERGRPSSDAAGTGRSGTGRFGGWRSGALGEHHPPRAAPARTHHDDPRAPARRARGPADRGHGGSRGAGPRRRRARRGHRRAAPRRGAVARPGVGSRGDPPTRPQGDLTCPIQSPTRPEAAASPSSPAGGGASAGPSRWHWRPTAPTSPSTTAATGMPPTTRSRPSRRSGVVRCASRARSTSSRTRAAWRPR